VLRDPAALLGAAENGLVEYSYTDAVKLAGHSCPTVAGAYLMTFRALAKLYPDCPPERGAIRVELHAAQADGTAGVTAAVAGLLTGAAGEGFKEWAGATAAAICCRSPPIEANSVLPGLTQARA
jgi:hypothetical protein